MIPSRYHKLTRVSSKTPNTNLPMKRPLILGERIMYVDAATPLNCVFTVKLWGAITCEQIRVALSTLQRKHPLLRASMVEDERGRPHFVVGEETSPIPVRKVVRTSGSQWKTESEVEWKTPFNINTEPLARVVWIRDDQVSEILLVCPHVVADGTTFTTLMREFLALLDNPLANIGTPQTLQPLNDLLPATRYGLLQVLKGWWLSIIAYLLLSLVRERKTHEPERDYMIHWKLSAPQTAALVRACKEAGTSVQAALCTSVLAACHFVQGRQARGKVVCPVDIRRFVPNIKEDTMFAFAPIVELRMEDHKNKDFWTRTRNLKAALEKKIEQMKVPEQLMMGEYLHGAARKMVRFLRATTGSHDFTISNMGRLMIPNEYESFDVDTIYSPSVAFPWRNPNTIIVSTYRGQMDVVLVSNDDFLRYADALTIKDMVMNILTTESNSNESIMVINKKEAKQSA